MDADLCAGAGGGIESVNGIGSVAAGSHHGHSAEVDQHKSCHCGHGPIPLQLRQDKDVLRCQDNGHNGRYQQKQHHGHGLPDAVERLLEEVGDSAGAGKHLHQRHELAEDGVVDQLHLKVKGQKAQQQAQHPLAGSGRQERTEGEQQCAHAQREQDGEDNPPIDLMIDAKMQHYLQIHRDSQSQDQGQPFPARRKEPFTHLIRLL